MDKTFANKNWNSNAEWCKDNKHKKKLNDASFWEMEKKIRVNTYRAKKKENQSEAKKKKKYSVWKESLRKQKYTNFKKAKPNVR